MNKGRNLKMERLTAWKRKKERKKERINERKKENKKEKNETR